MQALAFFVLSKFNLSVGHIENNFLSFSTPLQYKKILWLYIYQWIYLKFRSLPRLTFPNIFVFLGDSLTYLLDDDNTFICKQISFLTRKIRMFYVIKINAWRFWKHIHTFWWKMLGGGNQVITERFFHINMFILRYLELFLWTQVPQS